MSFEVMQSDGAVTFGARRMTPAEARLLAHQLRSAAEEAELVLAHREKKRKEAFAAQTCAPGPTPAQTKTRCSPREGASTAPGWQCAAEQPV
jgi:4'-phosphopantetheinyl transferase EntD